jgi:hypothetical protein
VGLHLAGFVNKRANLPGEVERSGQLPGISPDACGFEDDYGVFCKSHHYIDVCDCMAF